jgi:hypothetical protein
MKARATRIAAMVIAALTVVAAWDRPALASSDFRLGQVATENPITGEAGNIAVCRLFLGPRGDEVPAGQFLLRIHDIGPNADEPLELRGSVLPDLTLATDNANAEDFYEQLLRKKLHLDSTSEFELRRLLVHVGNTEADLISDAIITCGVKMVGFLHHEAPPTANALPDGPIHLIVGGAGSIIEGIQAPSAPLQTTSAEPVAPQVNGCQAPNFAPKPELCGTSNCLVTFKNYQWWTQYDFFSPPASPPDRGSGDWNANNKWSPKNVTVDAEGLHLFVRQQPVLNPQNGECCVTMWAAGEAVTARNLDNTVAQLGYGTYLVAAKVKTAASWAAMDPNIAFGVFTYERAQTGDSNNPGRELDLAEVSRWGRQGTEQQCIDEGEIKPSALCKGDAQFTYQVWDAGGAGLPNLHRYTMVGSTNEITLVMIWPGAQQQVTFRQYSGLRTLAEVGDTCNAQDCVEWKFPTTQNPWVPADGCQQFHLNLWMGNYSEASNNFNPPPVSGQDQEVVVTNFEYKPLSP